VAEYPEAAKFIRRFTGAAEWLRGTSRFCLWINDGDVPEAPTLPPIKQRMERVRSMRMASKATSTKEFAKLPHRFVQRAHKETSSIIVPSVSSGRRDYIPIGFLDQTTVIPNSANAIYGAEPWVFALIQ